MKNTVKYQYKSIVERLVFLRRIRKLSQEQIALDIGVDTKLFGEWERMVREPRLFNLLCWCEALQVYLTISQQMRSFKWINQNGQRKSRRSKFCGKLTSLHQVLNDVQSRIKELEEKLPEGFWDNDKQK